MMKLKTMALIGASALAVSAASTLTAQAQPWHDYGRPAYAETRLSVAYVDRLDARINDAARAGDISWNQAYHLRMDLRAVRPIAWRAQYGRANGWEYRRLSDTVARIEAQTQRYAYNDRDRYRPYDRDYDRDRDHDHDWRR